MFRQPDEHMPRSTQTGLLTHIAVRLPALTSMLFAESLINFKLFETVAFGNKLLKVEFIL